MKSIRSNLVRRLGIVMATFSFVVGGALFLTLRHTLISEFDRSLMLRAHALQSLVTQNSAGKLDIDLRLSALPEFTRKHAPEYFLLQDRDGNMLAASSNARIDAPINNSKPWETELPSGENARALRLSFQPIVDDDEMDKQASEAKNSVDESRVFTLLLARDTESLHATLWKVGLVIVIATVTFSAVSVLASAWIVQNGLKTLVGVASRAAALNLEKDNVHFDIETLPTELKPILSKFNELLAGLGHALTRERQFTAAISHELRTPIAELRAAADIALRDPTNLNLAVRSARHAQASADQLQTIVGTLLSMVTLERAAETIRLDSVDLQTVIQRALQNRASELDSEQIAVDEQVPPCTYVLGNAALLGAVFDNLVSNAAQYGSTASVLCIRTSLEERRVVITMSNRQTHLQSAEVERIFEPFWRKGSKPNATGHIGLGLALTRTYCQAMRANISAKIAGDQFCIVLSMEKAPPPLITPRVSESFVTKVL